MTPSANLEHITVMYRQLQEREKSFFGSLTDAELKTCEKIRDYMIGRGEKTSENLARYDRKIKISATELNRLRQKISIPEQKNENVQLSAKAAHCYAQYHSVQTDTLPAEMWGKITKEISHPKDQ